MLVANIHGIGGTALEVEEGRFRGVVDALDFIFAIENRPAP